MEYGDQTIQGQAAVLPASKSISSGRTLSDVDGDVSYTGFGFKPSSVIGYGLISQNRCANLIGWACQDLTTGCLFDDPSVAGRYNNTNLFMRANTSIGVAASAHVSSFDTDGFTITWSKTGSPTGIFALDFIAFK